MREGDGWSPLFVAAMLGRLETANLLLQAGADTSVRDSLDRTADIVARSFGHHSVADIIIRSLLTVSGVFYYYNFYSFLAVLGTSTGQPFPPSSWSS